MKYFINTALLLATLIVVLFVQQYFLCPQFDFSKPSPFNGTKWYNPYSDVKSENWVKCNFHAHTKAWKSITRGHGNAADIWKMYESMGYGIHCISNYHTIDESFSDKDNYIPAYEHGYNARKTHQLVIGDDEVVWLDYILPQNLSNKQRVLNKLSESGKAIVVLNHPHVRNGYTIEDMAYLHNFQCIEVLSPATTSFSVWDAALSAGKPVFIMGNDDLHYIFDSTKSGKCCTVLNMKQINKESILSSLRTGKGYGMRIGFLLNESAAQRIHRIKNNLPFLKYLKLNRDTIEVQFSDTVTELSFIGQEGKILTNFRNVLDARYFLKQNDQYVRTSVRFNDSTEIYLNPVFRYENEPFGQNGSFVINQTRSGIFFSIGILILFLWSTIILKIVTGKNFVKEIFMRSPRHFPLARRRYQ